MAPKLNTIYKLDSRKLDEVIQKKIISVTITSPPYFDLKDYGKKNQIGFGQTYEKYLDDLTLVFSKVFDVTKESGSLWVIIDTYKRNQKIVPLPFDFSKKMDGIGWKLRDIVIWNKDRTLPWSHKGKLRNIFEYVLVFSKNSKFKYQIDRVRESDDLKKWWIKYPERYNPNGKAPTEIWNYDIPTQGSWGNGYIKHFCPLPEELVRRIIYLTTNENDLVLDPFAGSGTVPAQASFCKRNFVGFEINEKYIKMFQNYYSSNYKEKRNHYENYLKEKSSSSKFKEMILKLRALKYARILLKRNPQIKNIYVEPNLKYTPVGNKILKVRYSILMMPKTNQNRLMANILKESGAPPLSKFGILGEIKCYSSIETLKRNLTYKLYYAYTDKNTHSYTENSKSILKLMKFPIISNLKVKIDEKSFNY